MKSIKRAPQLAVLFATAVISACTDSVVVTAPQTSTPITHTTTSNAPRTAPFWSGVYLGDAESTPENLSNALAQFSSAVGKRPALVKTFHNLDAALSSSGWAGKVLRAITASGATNYVALDLDWSGKPAGSLLEAIARGDADAAIDRTAHSLATISGAVLVEPAWEMNGNWNYAWQGVVNGNDSRGPQRYVAAWRHVVDRFRAAGAGNVRFVWNPNTGNPLASPGAGASSWNWYANYYPGDAYVDFVGAHGYNGPSVFDSPYHTFADLFGGADADYMLQDLETRYPAKPIILGEMAAEETAGQDKGTWIRAAYTAMLSDSHVVGAVWFNMKKEADWRVSSSAGSAAAYREMMQASAIKDAYDDSYVRSAAVMLAAR